MMGGTNTTVLHSYIRQRRAELRVHRSQLSFHFLVFALVCIDDPACTPKDKKLVQMVSDRIGKEFIATAEDDIILHTMLDLEQYLGQRIDWVSGESFDAIINSPRNQILPSAFRRYCTAEMKLAPMFYWWQNHAEIDGPVTMQIGFRAGEEKRAKRTLDKCNEFGLLEQKHVVATTNGNNKWAETPWQKPVYPLIENRVFRDEVVEFWKDKPVRFAPRNNCVGCFHRNPILLRHMWDEHPEKWNGLLRKSAIANTPMTGIWSAWALPTTKSRITGCSSSYHLMIFRSAIQATADYDRSGRVHTAGFGWLNRQQRMDKTCLPKAFG